MLQWKVFYVPFPEGGDARLLLRIKTFNLLLKELMKVVRGKIECLRFIPDSELRVQYVDDENTLIN